MKPGDLVEYNWDGHRKRGMIIKKSSFFGWVIYFPKFNNYDHLPETALFSIQQLTEEK